MQKDQHIKQAILDESRRLFFLNGYKKVTVDEIAAQLSISKKTIYKYYESKYSLLERVFEEFKTKITGEINSILDDPALSFPEKLQKVMSTIGMRLGGMNDKLFKDIQATLPELWNKINAYKQEAAFLRFNRLIDEGRQKGHIKKSINQAVIVALYASTIENLFNPGFIKTLPPELSDSLPDYSLDIFNNALDIIYEGILTPDTIASIKNS